PRLRGDDKQPDLIRCTGVRRQTGGAGAGLCQRGLRRGASFLARVLRRALGGGGRGIFRVGLFAALLALARGGLERLDRREDRRFFLERVEGLGVFLEIVLRLLFL